MPEGMSRCGFGRTAAGSAVSSHLSVSPTHLRARKGAAEAAPLNSPDARFYRSDRFQLIRSPSVVLLEDELVLLLPDCWLLPRSRSL